MLMVDLPIGTGFSKYSSVDKIPITVKDKVDHFYYFLQRFFDKYNDLRQREMYILTELRETQMSPLYAFKMATGGLKIKGIVNFANLSNPWLNH